MLKTLQSLCVALLTLGLSLAASAQPVPITALPSAALPLSGGEVTVIVQGGLTKQVPISNLFGNVANYGTYTATGGETTLTVAVPIVSAGHLILTRNGLYQLPSVDFTVAGTTTVTITPAAFAGEQFRWVTQ